MSDEKLVCLTLSGEWKEVDKVVAAHPEVALFHWLTEHLPPDFAEKSGLPGIEEESAFRLKETIFTSW